MVIYLGVDLQIRILCLNGEQKPNPASRKRADIYISIYSIRGHALVGGSPPAVRLPTAHTHHHLLLRVLGIQNPVTAFSFVCVLLICTKGLTFA